MSVHIRPSGSSKTGFTLVELLVVIGIIALLISMLLPALNRARQQAVVIDCQARMRTIGQAIHLYANENKGLLPASKQDGSGWNETWMPETLSLALGAKRPVDAVNNISPIFLDRDVKDYSPHWFPQRNHYNFNVRLFPDIGSLLDIWTAGVDLKLRQMSISKVKNSTSVVAAWDGYQHVDYGGNAFQNSMKLVDNIDGHLWWSTRGMDSQRTDAPGLYERPIVQTRLDRPGSVAFRHMQRKSANVLFLDGHVETKKEGELRVKDFCFAWRNVTPVRP